MLHFADQICFNLTLTHVPCVLTGAQDVNLLGR
jgi:hypothetical protein